MKSTFEQQLLSIICSVFDAYTAVLFLPTEDGRKHYLANVFSLGDNIPQDVSILPGKGLVGWIIHSRQPLLIDNFDKTQHNLGYYTHGAEEKIKAFMGFPIPAGGAICVDSKRQYSFSEKDLRILQLFAELLSTRIEAQDKQEPDDAARYFAELGVIQELRFRFRRWPEFLRNFLRVIARALRFDYCAFATMQENGDTYCLEAESAPLLLAHGQTLCIPVSNGITGWVFLNEQPVFAEPSTNATLFGPKTELPDFQTVICMPVMVNRVCRGVLCVGTTEPIAIDEGMRSFVRQAVDHLSLFLENLYLKNRLSQYLPRNKLQYEGGHPYDPDTAPMPEQNTGE